MLRAEEGSGRKVGPVRQAAEQATIVEQVAGPVAEQATVAGRVAPPGLSARAA